MSAILIAFALGLTFIGTQTSYWWFKVIAGFVWWGLAFYWNQLPVSTDPSLRTILVIIPIFVGLGSFFWGFWTNRKLPNGEEKSGFVLPFMSKEEDDNERTAPTHYDRQMYYRRRLNDATKGIRHRRR